MKRFDLFDLVFSCEDHGGRLARINGQFRPAAPSPQACVFESESQSEFLGVSYYSRSQTELRTSLTLTVFNVVKTDSEITRILRERHHEVDYGGDATDSGEDED
ncbi:hypothetical protein PV326_012110 [Microctonus aethiopoides]|nr:hypothetical protein PV326_012110 [Microctonus aethiopoides]